MDEHFILIFFKKAQKPKLDGEKKNRMEKKNE